MVAKVVADDGKAELEIRMIVTTEGESYTLTKEVELPYAEAAALMENIVALCQGGKMNG